MADFIGIAPKFIQFLMLISRSSECLTKETSRSVLCSVNGLAMVDVQLLGFFGLESSLKQPKVRLHEVRSPVSARLGPTFSMVGAVRETVVRCCGLTVVDFRCELLVPITNS